jgi:hypothetical protein
MKNEQEKLLLGLIISGVVGIGALYCLKAAQNRPTPVLKKIGKTISEVGEMLEQSNLSKKPGLLENIEERLPNPADVVSRLSNWVDIGLALWKTIKKE